VSGPGFSDFLESLGRPVAYYPSLAKVLGSIKASVLLSQLLYWSPRGKKADGWVFKTADELKDETGLSYEEQAGARKILSNFDVIESRYARSEHTTYFRVKREALNALWEASRKNLDAPEHLAKAQMAPGKSLGGTKGKPSSVFHRLPREYPETTKHPAPDGAGERAQATQALLLEEAGVVEAEVLEASPVLHPSTYGPTHAAAQNGHAPAAAAPARRGHPAIALFFDRWKAHHGKAPTINSKRIGILTQIYKGLGPEASEEYPHLLDAFFSSTDRFIIDNTHTPEIFQVKLDSLRVNGNGHGQRGAHVTGSPVPGRLNFDPAADFAGRKTGEYKR